MCIEHYIKVYKHRGKTFYSVVTQFTGSHPHSSAFAVNPTVLFLLHSNSRLQEASGDLGDTLCERQSGSIVVKVQRSVLDKSVVGFFKYLSFRMLRDVKTCNDRVFFLVKCRNGIFFITKSLFRNCRIFYEGKFFRDFSVFSSFFTQYCKIVYVFVCIAFLFISFSSFLHPINDLRQFFFRV